MSAATIATVTDDLSPNAIVFTWVNCAAFNVDPTGDYGRVFRSRDARDAALKAFREWAVGCGLSVTAATSGIYPVKVRAALLRGYTLAD